MTPYLIIHHWIIDATSGSLIHQVTGEQRRLGEYQLKLLQVLAEHAGEILTREELTNLVWERRVIGNNSLPNAIHALRLALEDDGKQQRIIKTIPKKGYILESEFCQFITPAELHLPPEAAEEPSDAVPVSDDALNETLTHTPADAPPAEIAVNSTAVEPFVPSELPATETVRERGFWRWLVLGQVIVLFAVAVLLARQFTTTPAAQLSEKNSVAYSNIRLIEVQRGWEGSSASQDLNRQLGPVLYALNQALKNRQVTMEVFFYTSGTSLNYTMTLKNRCDRRQLAMNIINWRTDGQQLSALIYREGERKINEMANCVTESAGDNAAAAAGSRADQTATGQ